MTIVHDNKLSTEAKLHKKFFDQLPYPIAPLSSGNQISEPLALQMIYNELYLHYKHAISNGWDYLCNVRQAQLEAIIKVMRQCTNIGG